MKAAPKKRGRSAQKPSETKARILIIDSDPVVAELLQGYLGGKKGYAVVAAATGVGGIRAAIEQTPDLILLDFRLADMGGLDVHERLRQNPATSQIPVIYLSAFLPLRTVEQATVKGARGFISKPFTLSEMYTKVASVLRSP